MRIISRQQNPPKTYTFKCQKCKTKFECDEHEVRFDGNVNLVVQDCPDCFAICYSYR